MGLVASRVLKIGVIGLAALSLSCSPGKGEGNGDAQLPADSKIEASTDVSGATLSDTQAGLLYLEIVNDVNCLMRRYDSIQRSYSYGDGTFDNAALPELQPVFGEASQAREIAVRRFLENTWPDSVAADIDLMARDWSRFARLEWRASRAADPGEFEGISNEINNFNQQANPGYIRATLGIGPASETDKC